MKHLCSRIIQIIIHTVKIPVPFVRHILRNVCKNYQLTSCHIQKVHSSLTSAWKSKITHLCRSMWACVRGRKYINFWLENLNERGSSEDIDIGWQIILKWEGVDRIHVAQDGDNCRTFVTDAMNRRFQICREFLGWLKTYLITSERELCSEDY